MKTHIKIITTLTLVLFISYKSLGQNITEKHKDSLNSVFQKYYNLNLKVFQSNSTIKDIDNIFKLFTDDFIYVHPKYGGTYTKENLYNGYIRNQRKGDYNGEIVAIEVQNTIIGLNVAMVQRVYKLKNNKKDAPRVTLFEFKEGKISKIFEYW